MMELNQKILQYLEDSYGEAVALLEALCKIPAPSHHEEKRAAFCKRWLESIGAKGVYIDDALNVVFPWCCEGKKELVAFLAHTDTVFPDMTEPMPCSSDGKNMYSPGVGDDTVCLVMMLLVVKYIVENDLQSDKGIVFVANSCEEGLGNLKGVKQLMKDFEGRIERLYTFDGMYDHMYNRCVGSHRYRLKLETKGGHSFSDFGNRNAICAAAELICALCKCQVPVEGDSTTTFNVGIIEGGTSVNTIAQNASFMYEYRSDDYRCLARMKEFFEKTVEQARQDPEVAIHVEVIGIRPCGEEVDMGVFNAMVEMPKRCAKSIRGYPSTSAPALRMPIFPCPWACLPSAWATIWAAVCIPARNGWSLRPSPWV